MEKAKVFLASPDVANKKKEMEVIGVPEICFLSFNVLRGVRGFS